MGFKLAGVMFLLMLGVSGGFYWYYSDTQNRMALMQENNAKLEIAVQTSEATVSALKSDIESVNTELRRVNSEFTSIRAQNQVLADKLAKHDLAQLGSSKPVLVQRIINNASAKVNRCFELLSGSPLTNKEKEAKSADEFNSECPWLWSGSAAN